MRRTGRRTATLLLALLGVQMALMIGGTIGAIPANAEPGIDEPSRGDEGQFLSSLQQLGIHFGDPAQAISAGHHVCGLAQRGESGLELINDLREQNPGLSTNSAAQFATVSAQAFCPKQLEDNHHGIS